MSSQSQDKQQLNQKINELELLIEEKDFNI